MVAGAVLESFLTVPRVTGCALVVARGELWVVVTGWAEGAGAGAGAGVGVVVPALGTSFFSAPGAVLWSAHAAGAATAVSSTAAVRRWARDLDTAYVLI